MDDKRPKPDGALEEDPKARLLLPLGNLLALQVEFQHNKASVDKYQPKSECRELGKLSSMPWRWNKKEGILQESKKSDGLRMC